MKKINLFLSIAIIAMTFASCNKYDAKVVTLNDQIDSLNYALGVANGAQLKMMYFANDSSNTPIVEFVETLDQTYKGKDAEPSEYEMAGRQVGNFFKEQAKNGLANNKSWKYDNEICCQGFVNGLYGYSDVLDIEPEQYLQSKYAAAAQQAQPDEASESKIKGNCPKTASNITLESEIDSLNYVFGYLNGKMMSEQMIANFSKDSISLIIDNVNEELSSKVKYPMLVGDARNIGRALRDMEGLFNDPTIEIRYDIIRQAMINGMRNDTVMLNGREAQFYIQSTMQARAAMASEPNRIAGESFLAENAEREGVVVTESGLQYEVLQKGKGRVHPKEDSMVKVHYHGTLIDGTVFDSSVERGTPTEFRLNQVIKGWTEGLQLMVEGDKYRFYIPYDLAYGDRDMGTIKPYSALIFDVELIEIK